MVGGWEQEKVLQRPTAPKASIFSSALFSTPLDTTEGRSDLRNTVLALSQRENTCCVTSIRSSPGSCTYHRSCMLEIVGCYRRYPRQRECSFCDLLVRFFSLLD